MVIGFRSMIQWVASANPAKTLPAPLFMGWINLCAVDPVFNRAIWRKF
jgi:hypothetical protein